MLPFFEKQDTFFNSWEMLPFFWKTGHFQICTAPLGFFLSIFRSRTGLKKLFSSSGIFRRGRSQPGCIRTFWRAEGTSQAGLGPFDQEKVPASLSLSLKSEKILALLYAGKGHLSTGHSVIWDLCPRLVEASTCSLWPHGQISNHWRACIQALLLYARSLLTGQLDLMILYVSCGRLPLTSDQKYTLWKLQRSFMGDDGLPVEDLLRTRYFVETD
jgi:hypothetical protein